jgi:hypothetical protein
MKSFAAALPVCYAYIAVAEIPRMHLLVFFLLLMRYPMI